MSEIFKNIENVNVDNIINIIIQNYNDLNNIYNSIDNVTNNNTNTTSMDKAKFIGIILAVKCIDLGNFCLKNAIEIFNKKLNSDDIIKIKNELNSIDYDDELRKPFNLQPDTSKNKEIDEKIKGFNDMLTILSNNDNYTKINMNYQLYWIVSYITYPNFGTNTQWILYTFVQLIGYRRPFV